MIIVSRNAGNERKKFIDSGEDFVLSRPDQAHAHMNFSQLIVCHSPSGLDWGYVGSGPADTALNILYLMTGNIKLAVDLHQDFKRDFIIRKGRKTPSFRAGI